jgi:hypothetical protein
MSLEENHPRDQLVRVLHFLDRFSPFLLRKLREAPVIEEPKCSQYWLIAPSSSFKASFKMSMTGFLPFMSILRLRLAL